MEVEKGGQGAKRWNEGGSEEVGHVREAGSTGAEHVRTDLGMHACALAHTHTHTHTHTLSSTSTHTHTHACV